MTVVTAALRQPSKPSVNSPPVRKSWPAEPVLRPILRPIAGFESTAYAWLNDRIVWAGEPGSTDHPRNAWQPWQPTPRVCDATRLKRGAQAAIGLLPTLPRQRLLPWLTGGALPFPLAPARPRLDAVREALQQSDIMAFETAALRVLGLGPGLTPSGDDFIGSIFFALAHAPRADWHGQVPGLQSRVRAAAAQATHAISAALLDDLIDGCSYRALHELVAALDSPDHTAIEPAMRQLLKVGASSGADMLAGVLMALCTAPTWTE